MRLITCTIVESYVVLAGERMCDWENGNISKLLVKAAFFVDIMDWFTLVVSGVVPLSYKLKSIYMYRTSPVHHESSNQIQFSRTWVGILRTDSVFYVTKAEIF